MNRDSLPSHFHEQYYRTRRSLVIFSGLLLAYELIGFEIGEKPITSFDVSVKSPNAVPIILIAVMIYYWIRYYIEWKQSDEKRRELSISQFDFLIHNVIPSISTLILLAQYLTGTQLVSDDILANLYRLLPLLFVMAMNGLLAVFRNQLAPRVGSLTRKINPYFASLFVFGPLVYTIVFLFIDFDVWILVVGLISIIIATFIAMAINIGSHGDLTYRDEKKFGDRDEKKGNPNN